MKEWRELMQERGTRTDTPMKPQVVAHELNKLLADDAIVATDSGTITTWAARHIDDARRHEVLLLGNLATMACGLPYAIARRRSPIPDRQVVAFVGDGGFTMLMGEFATARQVQATVKVVIIKNNTLGQIKWEQMVFLGNPEYGVELQPIDFVEFAEACGGVGLPLRATRRGPRRDAARGVGVDAARRSIEAVVDPFEPPMPAQGDARSRRCNFAESLARGEPHRRQDRD